MNVNVLILYILSIPYKPNMVKCNWIQTHECSSVQIFHFLSAIFSYLNQFNQFTCLVFSILVLHSYHSSRLGLVSLSFKVFQNSLVLKCQHFHMAFVVTLKSVPSCWHSFYLHCMVKGVFHPFHLTVGILSLLILHYHVVNLVVTCMLLCLSFENSLSGWVVHSSSPVDPHNGWTIWYLQNAPYLLHTIQIENTFDVTIC